ncbi:hypothetical protein M3P21_17860 [Ruegeria sp. 2012CJ41-6]|uniref:Uncharacterized protein n=1 Tax=Ruegeria spongiae TaxID=2942209 RepID=A0ABT0Q6A4_9RHOB|nr:hypothetical protein [Ruegeria spongiae]MCL6285398.1 hypothetical protein [Ruegeria spongiae]
MLAVPLLATPLFAQEEPGELPLDQRAQVLSAEAVLKDMQDPNRPGEAEISPLYPVKGGYKMCATTDAYNSSGTYIGRDYWEVTLDEDGQEVVSTRDVTGLNSPCYGVDYKPFEQLIEGAK